MDRKVFTDAEVADVADFNDIGLFSRDGMDDTVGGAIAYPRHWAGFTVSQLNPLEVGVSAGSLFAGEAIYRNASPATINIQTYLPIIASDRKFIAILADGAVAEINGQRLVEVDADTGETVSQSLPLVETRRIIFTVMQGAPSPTASKPAIPADRCCIAFVELSNTGVLAIEINHDLRAKSLYEVEGRLETAEASIADTQSQVGNMRTQIADIFARLGDIPSPVKMRQLTKDVATLRLNAKLPAEARAYWYDPGLLPDQWDTTNASWLARIREGVRFPWAAERDMQLGLLNADDPGVRFSGNLLLPAWTERLALEVLGDGGSVNISELVHTVVNAVQKTLSRTVTEYGPSVSHCENDANWSMLVGLDVGALFTKDGETWTVQAVNAWTNAWAGPGHRIMTVAKVNQYTVTDTYWNWVTTTVGLNGSICGQTFLNAQAMILTSIALSFKSVGSNGDVHLLLAECYDDGEPNFNQIIASTTKAVGVLAVGWVKFDLTPTMLDAGKRYAWFTVTTGNHALETVAGNKFAQGSRWLATDGAWAQPSVDSDFAMRLYAAQFAQTRTVVDFQPLTLENGIAEIRMLHAGWSAAGLPVTWRVKNPSLPNAEWQSLTLDNADGADDLVGLPPLVQLQAVFMGTTDLQPALALDAYARGMTFRPRGDCVAVGKANPFGLSSTMIQTETEFDHFDPAKHTAAPKLVIGGTVHAPSAVTTTLDAANAKKRMLLATFSVPATTSAAYRCDMTSTEVTDVPFIQDALMSAL